MIKAKKLPVKFEKVYHTFLDLVFYPNQPLDLLDACVSDEVMGYGTTLDEKLFGLEAIKGLAELQRSQAKKLQFHHNIKEVYRKMMHEDRIVVVVDEIKMMMQVDGNEVVLDVRMSSVWELLGESWKLVHWHGSRPEYDSGGTDTWHAEEWKKKNEELERQVGEKTADLAQKNRELEIETALERVRTAAMSMHKAKDLLDVCQIISEQLEMLEIKNIRNVQLAIINESSKTYSNYQFFAAYKKAVFEETNYMNNPASSELVFEMKKSAHSFFVGSMNGKEFKEFKDWRKQSKQFPDPILDDLNEAFYYFYSIGNGGLGLTTYQSISDAELDIFKRFHTVFKLAYSRFLDLQQAEKQTHEAEIQLALERVRARTMAMQKSEELLETVSLISTQLKELGEEIDQITIGVFKEDENLIDVYGTIKGDLVQTIDTPIDHSPMMSRIHKAWKAGEKSLIVELTGEELINYNKWRNNFLNKDIYPTDNPNESWFVNAAMFSRGMLGFSSNKQVSRQANELLERFADVFNLTYTRFIDLKKAEKQAREAQIETGLERARAQSMMMQHSNELNKTCQVFHEQLQLLGIDTDFSYLWLPEEEKNEHVFWATWQDDSSEFRNKLVTYPLDKTDPVIVDCYVAWGSENPVHVIKVEPENVASYFNDWAELLYGIEKFKPRHYSDGLYYVDAYMKYGCFGLMTRKLLTKDEQHFLHRFSKEFERAYTRFLDLKKAEEQAREAQVEAALERVRSRSIAMRNSDELADLSFELVKQVLALGIDNWFCAFNIYDDHPEGSLEWGSNAQGTYEAYRTPREGVFQKYYEAGQSGETLLINEINEKECPAHYDYLCSLPGVGKQLLAMKEAGIPFPKSQIDHVAFFKYGYVLFITFEHIPAAHHIFRRFAKVFEQSYTRFIDLKKAEDQAHEVQIELSLERIRAQVTIMQESSDLFDIVVDMRKEFLKLGHQADYFWYMHYSSDSYEMSMTSEDGSRIGMVITIPKYVHQNIPGLSEWENSDEPTYVLALDAEGAWDYIDNMNKHGHYKKVDPHAPSEEDIRHLGGLTFILARTTHGEIGFSISGYVENPPQDALDTLTRFASVFDLAYRRFEDLKSAERQNRETQIELALERIRTQVTSMNESSELQDIVVKMRTEFVSLGHQADYFWYMRYTEHAYEKAMTSVDGSRIGMVMTLPRHIHGDIKLVADWEKSNESTLIFPMDTETAVDYVDKMISLGDFQQLDPNAPTLDDIRSLGGLTFIMARTQYGEIGFSLSGEVLKPSEESIETLDRFASVFDLAYRRFEDLRNAESRTKEALKQATLDRVRGQVASMRSPEDLQQITPLIWNELKALEVPFFRCGIFIIDEKKKQVNVYLTTPEGKSLASFKLPFQSNPITDKTVESWRSKKIYQQHWNRDSFISWTKELMEQGQIKKSDKYQGSLEPPESLYLNFIPFDQGMIYIGNSDELSEENIDLVQSLAEALSYAYARYEDFIILEEAKAKVEKALGDLKETQTQLIHAEKMASLGELTAGVAHEIQNPLNFVNNFSEVNTELINELKEELEAGNLEEVIEIADDIASNEEKIKFHGSRADTIVRGMLQHSRNSNDEKIKTNINTIADEYMRLSFHGMRARDKSFQSDFEIDLADDLPEINVIPQDFGRVLLNLINNAFYAVNKRRQKNESDYKPNVAIKTVKTNDLAEIRITDNGTGIPKKNLKKIFQPFFTTKPTGEGTGLGLSLSFDIITKGHGGEMLVESEEGKGTAFIIKLKI